MGVVLSDRFVVLSYLHPSASIPPIWSPIHLDILPSARQISPALHPDLSRSPPAPLLSRPLQGPLVTNPPPPPLHFAAPPFKQSLFLHIHACLGTNPPGADQINSSPPGNRYRASSFAVDARFLHIRWSSGVVSSMTPSPLLQPKHGAVPPPRCKRFRRLYGPPPTSLVIIVVDLVLIWSMDLF